MTSEIFIENRGEAIKEHEIQTDRICLQYILYHRFSKDEERESYSIEISSFFENEKETAFAHDISSLRETAEEIFNTLCISLVTPCSLYDVLEELL